MADEVTIANSKDLANSVGNLVSLQFDKSINKLITNQNAMYSTQKVLALESSREQSNFFQRMLSALENFKANITLDAKKDSDTGLLGYLIKGLGLLGSGMLAFMGGFARGYFENFKKIIIDPIFKALEPIIDLVKGAVTKVGDAFKANVLDPFSTKIDEIKALFGPDGSIGKFFTKVKDFFSTKLLEPISLAIDEIKALFGPDGSIGKFFTKVKDFFSTKLLEPISLAIDEIKALFSVEGGGKVGKFFTKTLDFLKSVSGFDDLMVLIDDIKAFKFEDTSIGKTLSKVKGFFGTTAGEGGIFSKITDFISPFTDFKLPDGVSKILGGIGKIFGKVFFVVDLFMGFFAAFEAFNETEGSLGDKIIAAIKAFIDEVVFGLPNFLIDLVGKGAAAIFRLFGKEDAAANIEKATENFSLMTVLSENFEKLLDGISKFFDNLFSIDVNSIIKSIPGGETLMKLFGAGESSKARTQLASIGLEQGSTDFGKWDVDIEELRNKIQGMNKEQLEMIQNNIASLAMSDEIDNLKEIEEVLVEKARGFKTGGLVAGTGLAVLHGTPSQPELVLDNQATAVFMKAAQLLTGSQALEMRSSSQPVIINNIDNSQRNPVISNQATRISVPDSARQGESTMTMMNMAFGMG